VNSRPSAATAAPLNHLDPTAEGYLADLHDACTLARLHRDRAGVEARAEQLVPHGWQHGGMLNSPTLYVCHRHIEMTDAAYQAETATYRTAVAWYARAATMALERILAGRNVTANELERLTLRQLRPRGVEEPERTPDGWDGPNMPPIPEPTQLSTGHADTDRAVATAYEPLAVAYRNARAAAGWEEEFNSRPDGDFADHEASLATDAAAAAEPLWDLLHAWARKVEFAAIYGRSRARGHHPAPTTPADGEQS
jgi:hypothetical protein